MEKIKKLQKCYLFSGIEPEFLKKIADNTDIVSFNENEFIFFEGEAGKHFYIILEGKVEIYKSSSDDREIILRTIERDEIFAEVIIFEQDTYPATAKTLSKTKLLKFNKDDIIQMLENTEFRTQFIRTLFQKMRELGDRLKFLNSMDVEERFFFYLSSKFGKHQHYEINLSKKEFAREIGTIPETLSRMLKKFETRGISWNKNIISLPENFWL